MINNKQDIKLLEILLDVVKTMKNPTSLQKYKGILKSILSKKEDTPDSDQPDEELRTRIEKLE